MDIQDRCKYLYLFSFFLDMIVGFTFDSFICNYLEYQLNGISVKNNYI